MPSFGDAKDLNPLGKTVNSTDVLIGAAVGLVGGGLVNYGIRTYWTGAPAMVQQYAPVLTPVAAGFGAYAFLRRKSKARAQGILAGAVAIGVIPYLWGQIVKPALPASVTQYFGDPVVSMPGFGGLLTRSPGGYHGLLTASPGGGAFAALPAARRALGY